MLRSMQGHVDEARDLMHRGWATVLEAGHVLNAASKGQRFAFIERRAGGPDVEKRIEEGVRPGFEELLRLDDRSFLPTVALDLAASLVRQGRFEETRELCELARERTLPDDIVNFVYLDQIEALLAAARGALDEAENSARRSVERAETTDFFSIRGMRARGALAEVLWVAGKREEATAVASDAAGHPRRQGRRGRRRRDP